jgi:glycosyltransferase involved in cell wall biosynthesis
MTRLSIILPNYNQGRLFIKLIPKLLNCVSENDELIFVDDGSTDNSLLEVSRLVIDRGVKNFRIYENRTNCGVPYTANKAARLARGEFLYFAAGDDDVSVNFFRDILSTLEGYSGAGLASSGSLLEYPSGETITMPLFPPTKENRYVSPDECLLRLKARDNWVTGNSCVFRRSAFLECGGFREELKGFCDVILILRILAKCGAVFISKPLTTFRLSKKSYAAQHFNEAGLAETLSIVELSREILEEDDQTQGLSRYWYRRVRSQIIVGCRMKSRIEKIKRCNGLFSLNIQLFYLFLDFLSSFLELLKAGQMTVYILRFIKIRMRLLVHRIHR